MSTFTNQMNVTFFMDYMTVTTSVSDPDIDDRDYIVKQAAELIKDEYGFDPLAMSSIPEVVTDEYGEEIE